MKEDWNSLEFVCLEPRWIANDRRISAEAARNARRRLRRGRNVGIHQCYGCFVWSSRSGHRMGPEMRSRMNPNRTTWGKTK